MAAGLRLNASVPSSLSSYSLIIPGVTAPFFTSRCCALTSTTLVPAVRSISDPLPAIFIPSAPSKVNTPALVVKFEAALASSEIALVDAASSVISSAASMSTPAAPSKVNAPALVEKFEAALRKKFNSKY